MVRIESILRTWRGIHQKPALGVCIAIMPLGWATPCAASGFGIGLKAGVQTLDSPIDLDETTRARLELELSSPPLWSGHMDLALTFGGSPLGSFSDEYSDFVDGVLIEDSFTSDLGLFDVRLAARLYPFGVDGRGGRDRRHADGLRIAPYVGAGLGYFCLKGWWEEVYSETFEDADFPGVFHTFTDVEDGRDTIAKGFFPFVVAGVAVPCGPRFELLFEFQYDFDKEDAEFDLGGPTYMLGCRLRW